jgi:hypothetical protein
MLFLEAIARQEGFYVPDSRPNRNNNPGDLEFHGWETVYGGSSSPHDTRFTYFDSVAHGFEALRHLFTFSLYFGKTFQEAFEIYAPVTENHTSVYLANVCTWTNKPPSTIITLDLLTLPTEK